MGSDELSNKQSRERGTSHSCFIIISVQCDGIMSSYNTLTLLRGLSSMFWSVRSSHEASKVLKTTNCLLRCFLFFDICYLLSGISLIVMALTEQFANRDKMIMFGGMFGVLASVSALCNSMASHGIRTWRRLFLLPWHIFFSSFFIFSIVAVFTCWRHMQRQYLMMAYPRPQTLVLDVESVMRELPERDPNLRDNVKDSP